MNTPAGTQAGIQPGTQPGAWRGKAAVVTGAANGIGLALAERFVAEGMRVVMADIDDTALQAQVRRLADAGHAVWGQRCDVTSEQSVQQLADMAQAMCGPLHLVCNNAGIGGGAADALPIWQASPADWKWVLDINVWGVIHGLRAFVPRLIAHGEPAHVVNTASRAGLMSSTSLYSTSKHTVVALTEALHAQLSLAGASVRAAVLCPGAVNTALADNSQRLRPGAAPGDDGASDGAGTTALLDSYRRTVRARMAAGMAPQGVAELLMQGLEQGQFYIHPGAADDPPVRARGDNIHARHIADLPRAFPQFDWSTRT